MRFVHGIGLGGITLHVMKLILTDERRDLFRRTLVFIRRSVHTGSRLPMHALLPHKVPEQQLEGPLAEVTVSWRAIVLPTTV
jgi:hypothetical protein